MLRSIEAERARNQLTKEELATKLGISVKTYYNWLYEETDIPGTALLKMSALFKKDVEYLMEGCTRVNLSEFLEEKGV